MRLDIEPVIDAARLGPLQWRVLILCALVTAFQPVICSRWRSSRH